MQQKSSSLCKLLPRTRLPSVISAHSLCPSNHSPPSMYALHVCCIVLTVDQARRAVELVSALQLISDRDGPSVYFSFSGLGSAIALPPIKTWPNSTGFTFTTWVRFERMCMKAADTYRPFLYTFRTTQNQGYLAYFGESTLCLESTDAGGAVVSKHECPFPAELFQWYMVTVSVVKHQMRKSQVSVYINGELASSGIALLP